LIYGGPLFVVNYMITSSVIYLQTLSCLFIFKYQGQSVCEFIVLIFRNEIINDICLRAFP